MQGPVDLIIVSVGVGVVLAILGWLGAVIVGRKLGAARAASPYVQGHGRAIMFNLAVLIMVGSKMLFVGGLIPGLAGAVAIWIVSRPRVD